MNKKIKPHFFTGPELRCADCKALLSEIYENRLPGQGLECAGYEVEIK